MVLVLGIKNATAGELKFTENKGQVSDQNGNPRPDVLFSGEVGGMVFHIRKDGVSYQLYKATSTPSPLDSTLSKRVSGRMGRGEHYDSILIHRIDIDWTGCNSDISVEVGEETGYYLNYYLPSCPEGITGVRSYKSVTIKNVWDGIDVRWYSKNGNLEYDFILEPGTDIGSLSWSMSGAEKTWQEGQTFVASTAAGSIHIQRPSAFQNGRKIEVWRRFEGIHVWFETDSYNEEKELIIDPIVRVWGTYVGGIFNEFCYSGAVDGSGNVYLAGTTNSSTAIATSGAFQTSISTGQDAFLSKLDDSGSVIWSTYYGGTSFDLGKACGVDGSSNVYLAGHTMSDNLATSGSYQTSRGGGEDVFMVKFNSSGARQWASYFGGTSTDNLVQMSVKGSSVFLAGLTFSTSGIATSGAAQSSLGGSSDGFLAVFNTSGQRQWSTYYGGSSIDNCTWATSDQQGNVYLTGYTSSSNNIATSGGHQTSFGSGSSDAFLVKFNSSGSRQWGTYYGGNSQERSYGCAIDTANNVYLVGNSGSSSGIATSGSYQASLSGLNDIFLVKFNTSGVRQWGTYYGGTGNDNPWIPVYDQANGIYIPAHTSSTSGIATPGSPQDSLSTGYDACLVKFDVNGNPQFGTYCGGSGTDYGQAMVLSPSNGNLYLLGYTNSPNNISTTGIHQDSLGGLYDAFLVQYQYCNPDSSSMSVTACDSFVSPSGNQVWDSSGIYIDTLTNVSGCDSILTVTLTILNSPAISPGWNEALCNPGPSGIYVFASGGVVSWYDSLNSTTVLDTGTNLSIPWLDSSRTYYAEVADSACTSKRIPVQALVFYDDSVYIDTTVCISYDAPDHTVRNTSGHYIFTVPKASGCDSVYNVNLTVKHVDVRVDAKGHTLTSKEDSASYQWIDCSNHNIIPGATGKSFNPGKNGKYAVIVTQDSCTDTSACYNLNWIGMRELSDQYIDVYPNPAENNILIDPNGLDLNGQVSLINASGQMVLKEKLMGAEVKILAVHKLPRGLYELRIESQDGFISMKIILN